MVLVEKPRHTRWPAHQLTTGPSERLTAPSHRRVIASLTHSSRPRGADDCLANDVPGCRPFVAATSTSLTCRS